MDQTQTREWPGWLAVYAKVVMAVALLLVWWGAAVTTEEAGMAFADWPLSRGSVNPEGWLEHWPYFLEHGHRLIASLTGVLTLLLFAFTFVNSWKRFFELLALVLWLGMMVGLFGIGGAERESAERKVLFFSLGSASAVAVLLWLGWSWWKRQWPLATKVASLALLMVVTQAILGGLRVTEISDTFATMHGCFGQAFFCVLVLAAMVVSRRWEERRLSLTPPLRCRVRRWGAALWLAVFAQLILGAVMRHHHRFGLADDGILLTDGKLFPGFDSLILGVMFLHKYWALAVLGLVTSATVWVSKNLGDQPKGATRLPLLVLCLILVQLILGVSVIMTGKSFWVTNVHVLNGLSILAVSFAFLVRSFQGKVSV